VDFDEHPTKGIDDLHKLLTDERINHESTLTVIRGTQRLNLPVTPAETKMHA